MYKFRKKIKVSQQQTEEGSTPKAMMALGIIFLGGILVNRFCLTKQERG